MIARNDPVAISTTPEVPLRGRWIMTPERLSTFTANRLSFAPSLIRRMARERWQIDKTRFELDRDGRGIIVYRITMGQHIVNFLVLSDVVDAADKHERAFVEHWDG